ncbi:MAG: CPBP family intramembrane metalloprotease [Nocardioides sp.]|nr:CPBP family intramembrane metalloprotease [Nocardioides sp.]
MTVNTPRTPLAGAQPVRESAQYSLLTILAIWSSVAVPMGLLAFVAAPVLIAQSTMNPGLVYWMLMVVGMIWQFIVSLTVLRLELKTLRWSVLRTRLWVNRPRHPKTGQPGRAVWLWIVPALVANALGGLLALGLDVAWLNRLREVMDPRLIEPVYTTFAALDDPSLQGQWWILGLAMTSALFNYLLGEELLFRGVLLPRMAGVFGRWDWVANTVLFGLYHVHKIWYWPSLILGSLGFAWATKRFRSIWMAVIMHGLESFFLVIVFARVLGIEL